MLKKVILGTTLGLMLTTGGLNTATTIHAATSNAPDITNVKSDTSTDPQTLIVAANGKLDGQMVPYIKGIPGTGKMTLHYSAENYGFVDGDYAYLTVLLPDEFKFLASIPDFANHVSGEIRETSIVEKTTPISKKNTKSYTDRLVIEVPKSLWIGAGDVAADIVIDYGEFIEKYPNLPVSDAPAGYKFTTQVKYDSAMWDVIHDPIFGTDDDTLYTDETQAIYPVN